MNTYFWTTRGVAFVCYEHGPIPCSDTQAPLTHTLTLLWANDDDAEIGSAVSLMDAHALSRSVRTGPIEYQEEES